MVGIHVGVGTSLLVVSLVVGIWALSVARRGQPAGMWVTLGAFVAVGLLIVQALLGADLWFRGLRPSSEVLSWVHVLGPVAALLHALYTLFFSRGSRASSYATTGFVIFVIALVSFGIGEMG